MKWTSQTGFLSAKPPNWEYSVMMCSGATKDHAVLISISLQDVLTLTHMYTHSLRCPHTHSHVHTLTHMYTCVHSPYTHSSDTCMHRPYTHSSDTCVHTLSSMLDVARQSRYSSQRDSRACASQICKHRAYVGMCRSASIGHMWVPRNMWARAVH